jgi:hypothetical protein
MSALVDVMISRDNGLRFMTSCEPSSGKHEKQADDYQQARGFQAGKRARYRARKDARQMRRPINRRALSPPAGTERLRIADMCIIGFAEVGITVLRR